MRRFTMTAAVGVLLLGTAPVRAAERPAEISVRGSLVDAVPTVTGVRVFGLQERVGFASPPVAIVDRATGKRVLGGWWTRDNVLDAVADGHGGAWLYAVGAAGEPHLIRIDARARIVARVGARGALLPLVVAGEVLAHAGPGGAAVVARDVRSGRVLWRRGGLARQLVAGGGDALLVQDGRSFAVLDARTGRPPVSGLRHGRIRANAAVIDEATIAFGGDRDVRLYDRASGRLIRRLALDVPSVDVYGPPLGVLGLARAGGVTWIGGDFTGFAGTRRLGLAGIADDGALLPDFGRTFPTDAPPEVIAADARGAVALSGVVVAVEPRRGARRLLRGLTNAPARVVPLGDRLLVITQPGTALRSTPAGLVTEVDLARRRIIPRGAPIRFPRVTSSAVSAVDGGRAWVAESGFGRPPRTVVRLVDGIGRTIRRLPRPPGVVQSIAGDRRRVVASLFDDASAESRLVALDLRDDPVRWRIVASCTTCAGYGPLAQRGALVVAASGAELIAVDLERGSERWRSAMRGGVGVGALAIVGSRVLAAGDGTGVRRTERHPIDAVDIQSGRTLDWGPTVTVGAGGRMRPGAIGDFEPVADGVLLCGGFDRVGGRRRVGLALVGDDGNVRPWRRDVLPGCTRARLGHGRIAVNQLFDVLLVPAPRIG